MIKKVLIANRGEVACRIIRTCHEMGIATVAVYSDADANALYVEMADEAVHIGASPPTESYLSIEKIIGAAWRTGADAVHPGYGFLAENPRLAYAVISADLIFVGPPPSALEIMGRKRAAKMLLHDVPVVPGYTGDDQSDEAMIVEAGKIGFPLMVKASAGGGGKGMRQVDSKKDLLDALQSARREAEQAFGDDTLILEKAISKPRHVEVQIFGDQDGKIIALGERECTIQRRYQKIIEETPSTVVTPELREQMFAVAISVGEQLGYYSAGTVEFLVDGEGNFYFMEMNTRLQVEHPVTEAVYRVDLVRWQLLIAEGYPLPDWLYEQRGHAIEARIYAEDPSNGFLPVTGDILRWHPPDSVRVDSGVRSGDAVTVHYDPMLAKVVAYGENRTVAVRRLDHALSQFQLLGIRNNIAFLRRVLMHPGHLAGDITTNFIDEHSELLEDTDTLPHVVLVAAAIAKESGKERFRNNPNRPMRQVFAHGETEYEILLTPQKDGYAAQIGKATYSVHLCGIDGYNITLSLAGHRQTMTVVPGADDMWWVHRPCSHNEDGTFALRWTTPLPLPGADKEAVGSLRAPMPGQIIAVMVEIGQQVEKDEALLTLEAMKMEHRIEAPYAGTVKAIHYAAGDSVQADEILLELEASET